MLLEGFAVAAAAVFSFVIGGTRKQVELGGLYTPTKLDVKREVAIGCDFESLANVRNRGIYN
jgi:hypothetical protein